MMLDKDIRSLLQKTLKIRDSEVPFYRVLDILATRDGDVSEVINRYSDIKEPSLRTAFHNCAVLLRQLAAKEGLLPAWEVSESSEDAGPRGPKPATGATKKTKQAEDLTPFIDESARGKVTMAKLYIDGASKGNPGPAGIGIALFSMDGQKLAQQALAIGETTNNMAEYTALIEGMKLAQQLGIRNLHILSDSQLLVQQMNGNYKIKNAGLQSKVAEAQELLKGFDNVSIHYISREHNKLADALSNYALKTKSPTDK